MKTVSELEQYKRIQTRYTALTELDIALERCLYLDQGFGFINGLDFLPPKDYASLLKSQAKIQKLMENLQKEATKLYKTLKR